MWRLDTHANGATMQSPGLTGAHKWSASLRMQAVRWRLKHGRVAAQQAAGSFPWIGVEDPSEPQADHAARVQESANFQLGGPEKLTGADDPQHALQKNGGLADLWYMDDDDIMCHPDLDAVFPAGIRRRQR